jgi:hypothetical protein
VQHVGQPPPALKEGHRAGIPFASPRACPERREGAGSIPAVMFSILLLAATVAHSAALSLRPAAPVVVQSADAAPAAFLVLNSGPTAVSTTLELACPDGAVTPQSFPIALQPKEWKIVAARVTLSESANSGEVICRAADASAHTAIIRGFDLTSLPWKRTFTARGAPPDPRWASPDLDDSTWPEIRVPALWNEVGYAWCRARVTIPEQWRGRKLRLIIGAVDDNDVTYLNGQEIGRTTGWDVPREYILPQNLIHWGAENLLTIMADNTWAGGGIYKPPVLLVVGGTPLPAAPPTIRAIARPKPGNIGKPLPLRRFHVKDGVLRYPEGDEVALWGVNYYPQSWYQFENMQRLWSMRQSRRKPHTPPDGVSAPSTPTAAASASAETPFEVDMKATIRRDLDHLQRMGVEAIRIHVFDREISDGQGDIGAPSAHSAAAPGAADPNIHLDLLDYLVAQCGARGIYMYFTPIAWWGGPNERKDSFSAQTSKPGMMFVPAAKAAAANYLRQFLNHTNRYSARAYKDEPCLCLLEVQNEPAYFLYADLTGSGYAPQGEAPDILERDRRAFRELWRKWLADHGLEDSPAYFPLFRYELMRSYIREMVSAIRSTGAPQPVAISSFGVNGDDLTDAIADSECDAITVSAYPGGWERVNDGINLLPQMGPTIIDPRLGGKARLAYEFDTPATNTSCYLYPAIAASFRAGEVQVACQFQYDSVATARWNTDWGAHWLNWLYTPSKTVSYMIAGETFRRLPRGIRYTAGKEELKLGPMATSFSHNLSLLVAPDTVMYSRTASEWSPIKPPASPSRIVGVGNSPYVEYGGTGLYVLERKGTNGFRLTVNPDARLVGNSLVGSFAAPVAELEQNRQWFRLKLRGWENAACYRGEACPEWNRRGRAAAHIPRINGGWLLRPGEYHIRRGR